MTNGIVSLCLRLAIGIPEALSSVQKLQDLPEFLGVWHDIHFPAAALLAPAFAGAELLGALLLVVGWKTRTVALLFVAELVSEILLTKRPLLDLTGWTLEWQSLLIVLALVRLGAGAWSLDGLLARAAGPGTGGATRNRGAAEAGEADGGAGGLTRGNRGR